MSYADMLKNVKETMNEKEEAKNIKYIRKTKDGKMLITTNSQRKEETDKLAKLLKSGPILNQASILNKEKARRMIIHIKGMDGTITKEEMEKIIKNETNLEDADVEVSNLRPIYGENQAATIKIPEAKAKHLLKKEESG